MNTRLSQVWAWGALLCLVSIGNASAATSAFSKADRVNVRSRPGYVGEIITQLTRGEALRVIGTNLLSKPAPDEPSTWYKIELPETSPLWVSAEYVDADTKTVKADVLNVRAGPSYDHASVARVTRGTVLNLLGDVRDGWLQVAAPAGAFGFVPANWVTFDAAGAAAPLVPPAASSTVNTNTITTTNAPPTPSTPKPSTNAPPSGATPTGGTASTAAPATSNSVSVAVAPSLPVVADTPAPAPATSASPSPAGPSTNQPASPSVTTQTAAIPAAPITRDEPESDVATSTAEEVIATSEAEEETQGRRVRREGLVVRPSNLKAPTFYALKARDSGKTINFLFTSRSLPIQWREYWGKVVWITGREYLDQRHLWRGIPLLDVEDIEAVR